MVLRRERVGEDRPMSWGPTLARRGLYWLGFTYIAISSLYDRFYGAFRVSSSDVGFGPAQGVGDIVGGVLRVGVWLTAMLLTVTLIPFGCAVALAFVAERCSTARRDDGKDRGRLAQRLARWIGVTRKDLVVAVLAATGLWLFAFNVLGTVSGDLQAFAFVSIAVVPVGWWIYTRRRKDLRASSAKGEGSERDGRVRFWRWEKARRRQLANLLTVYAVASTAFIFIDLWGDAAEAAREAQRVVPQCGVPYIGAPLPSWLPPLHAHVTLLAVRAEPATIRWIGNDEPTGLLPSNALDKPIFLGDANGSTLVAVRHSSGVYQVVRIPDTKVVVDVDTAVNNCPSVH